MNSVLDRSSSEEIPVYEGSTIADAQKYFRSIINYWHLGISSVHRLENPSSQFLIQSPSTFLPQISISKQNSIKNTSTFFAGCAANLDKNPVEIPQDELDIFKKAKSKRDVIDWLSNCISDALMQTLFTYVYSLPNDESFWENLHPIRKRAETFRRDALVALYEPHFSDIEKTRTFLCGALDFGIQNICSHALRNVTLLIDLHTANGGQVEGDEIDEHVSSILTHMKMLATSQDNIFHMICKVFDRDDIVLQNKQERKKR